MKPKLWFVLIPLFGNFFAFRRLGKLYREIEELKKNRETLIKDLGGDIDKLKILLGYHGSVEKIEKLLKSPVSQNKDDELMALIQEKYGSLRSMASMLEDLEQKLTRKEYELENLHLLLGGRDNLEEIKRLRDDYGSFSKIHEKIKSLENLTRNFTGAQSLQENLEFLENIKKFGNLEDIQHRLSQLDEQKEKVIQLTYERDQLSHTLNSQRENLDFVESIKKYGNFEDIQHKLSQFDVQRENISKLTFEKDHLSQRFEDQKENIEFAENVKKFGNLEDIQHKLSQFDNQREKIIQLTYEKDHLLQTLDSQRTNIEFAENVKKFGNLEDIQHKLSQFDIQRENLSKLTFEKDHLAQRIEDQKENVEFAENIKKFGNLEDIQHKLSQFDVQRENISQLTFEKERLIQTLDSQRPNVEFAENIKKYGGFGDIQQKLSQFDVQRNNISQLTYEREHLSKTISDLNENLNSKSSKLQSLLMDIGGEELIPKIKHLRDSYGSFDSIESYMEQFKSQKNIMIEITEKNRSLEEKNRLLDQEVKTKEGQFQNLMQILGGTEELKFAEDLKNTYASFRSIKEKMDMLPELEDKHRRMKELEEHVGEETWVFDQLKEKMISRRNSFRFQEEEIESNFLRLGERFRQECVDTIKSIFPQDDGDAYYKVEDDRKDITAGFMVEGNKRFEVVIECKAIEQYFKNSPVVLTPPLREKDLESVRDQLKKAEKQLSKVETKKVKVTVISVPYERFEEYGIKNEIQFSQSRELEKIIISKPCLRPLLLSLKVLCKNFNPVVDFEKLVDTYSNPDYVEMISQIYTKMEEWEESTAKLLKKKDQLDKEYRLFTTYFEKIRRFMREWTTLIQNHHTKALSWTSDPKLLSSFETIEVEEVNDDEAPIEEEGEMEESFTAVE